jgi:hypothetical protein
MRTVIRPTLRAPSFYEVVAILGAIAGVAAYLWAASEPGSSLLHPHGELGIYPIFAWVLTFAAAGIALAEKRGRSLLAAVCAAVAIIGTALLIIR